MPVRCSRTAPPPRAPRTGVGTARTGGRGSARGGGRPRGYGQDHARRGVGEGRGPFGRHGVGHVRRSGGRSRRAGHVLGLRRPLPGRTRGGRPPVPPGVAVVDVVGVGRVGGRHRGTAVDRRARRPSPRHRRRRRRRGPAAAACERPPPAGVRGPSGAGSPPVPVPRGRHGGRARVPGAGLRRRRSGGVVGRAGRVAGDSRGRRAERLPRGLGGRPPPHGKTTA